MNEIDNLPDAPAPRLPVPPPLRGLDKGSFTEQTILERMPRIGRQIFAENELWPAAARQLQALLDEMPREKLRPFTHTLTPDMPAWQEDVAPYLDQNWLEAPWFVVETYFYRRIAEAVDYFHTGFDPFSYQKQQSLATTAAQTRLLAAQWAQAAAEGWQEEAFVRLLKQALWGNQADMSMWSADGDEQPSHADAASQDAHLLVDDAAAVAAHLAAQAAPVRVDVIADNAGFELIGDLCLAAYLLQTERAQTVWLHLKLHPTFVSDATAADVLATAAWLARADSGGVRRLGEQMYVWLGNGRLQLRTHPFWTSPLPLWRLSVDLRHELAASALVINKGDANYRRALGDAHWPYTIYFPDVVSYFPAPIAFLRTCKSGLAAGLPAGMPGRLARQDPDWLTSGEWGVLQAVVSQH